MSTCLIPKIEKPSDLEKLPAEIYTPSEPPACGLLIDTGKEYLLAVSHVNVTGSSTFSNETELSRLLYTVTHVEVLKEPNGNSSLSQTISTPSESAACGVVLDIGKGISSQW
ncbi:hypothetical protein OSTOST_08738 [Ostertagia ostertagi]